MSEKRINVHKADWVRRPDEVDDVTIVIGGPFPNSQHLNAEQLFSSEAEILANCSRSKASQFRVSYGGDK